MIALVFLATLAAANATFFNIINPADTGYTNNEYRD